MRKNRGMSIGRKHILLPSLLLCFVLWPGEAYAARYSGGAGTEDDPFVIATVEDLKNFASDINGAVIPGDGHYVQSGDIVWDGTKAIPAGNIVHPFKGTYDGRGFVIRNFLISDNTFRYVGLFGRLDGAVIRNVTLEASSVRSTLTVFGENNLNLLGLYVGSLAGEAVDSTLFNCVNSGDVTGGGAGNFGMTYTGGLVGCIRGTKTRIAGCRNRGTVAGGTATAGNGQRCAFSFTGGIAGGNDPLAGAGIFGSLEYCVNEATIRGGNASGSGGVPRVTSTYAGGLIGFGEAAIRNCGNRGEILSGKTTLPARSFSGGLAGALRSVSLISSYSVANIVKDKGNGNTKSAGALIGEMENVTMPKRSYFLSVDGLAGVDPAFKSGDMAVALSPEDFGNPAAFEGWSADEAASAWFWKDAPWPEPKILHIAPVPRTLVFSAGRTDELPFILSPVYEGLVVSEKVYGDGVSSVPDGVSGGRIRFDAADGFEGDKEIRLVYTVNGMEMTVSMTVSAIPVPFVPDPEPVPPAPLPDPDPEPGPPDPAPGPEPEPGPRPVPPPQPLPIPVPDPHPGASEDVGDDGDASDRAEEGEGCNGGWGLFVSAATGMAVLKKRKR